MGKSAADTCTLLGLWSHIRVWVYDAADTTVGISLGTSGRSSYSTGCVRALSSSRRWAACPWCHDYRPLWDDSICASWRRARRRPWAECDAPQSRPGLQIPVSVWEKLLVNLAQLVCWLCKENCNFNFKDIRDKLEGLLISKMQKCFC